MARTYCKELGYLEFDPRRPVAYPPFTKEELRRATPPLGAQVLIRATVGGLLGTDSEETAKRGEVVWNSPQKYSFIVQFEDGTREHYTLPLPLGTLKVLIR